MNNGILKAETTMVARRALVRGLAAFALFSVAGPAFAGTRPNPAFVAGARRFIEGMADQAVVALADQSLSREQRIERFRGLLGEHFDVPTIGQWVLGATWRQATRRQRREFLTLFEDLVVATYVERFSAYAGERLTVTGADGVGSRDVAIRSRISRPGGHRPIQVDWRVRAEGGSFRIVDVIVENVSLGQTQRSEFASMIRRHGGRVDRFLSVLRGRVRDLAERQA